MPRRIAPKRPLLAASLAAVLVGQTAAMAPVAHAQARPAAAAAAPASGRSRELSALSKAYLEGLFRAKPHLATFMGDHRFDARHADFSPPALKRRAAELKGQLRRLKAILPKLTQVDDRVDAEILRDGAELELLYLEEIRDWAWDPRLHDSFPYYDPREFVADRLSTMLYGEYAPVGQRQRAVIGQLNGLPTLLKQLKAGYESPSKIYVERAIAGNEGRIDFFKKAVAGFVKDAPGGPAALAKAVAALEDFQRFLTNDLLPRAHGDWRLGNARYHKKFPLALQTSLSPEQVVPRAEAAFFEARQELFGLARKLYGEIWPTRPVPVARDPRSQARIVEEVKAALTKDHPRPEELVREHAANLDRMRAFIERNNLLELPPKETLAVKEMPAFKRGAQAAEYLAPGILENVSKWEATYYVDPVDPSWPADRVESYMRGQNRYQVELTAIHEAYPGHHTHFYYMRKAKNPLRSVLWNAPLAEGWAVYGEKQLVALGYGERKNARYRFFQLQGLMIVATNALIDIKLHTGKMSDAEAVRFMVEEGFQEQAVAEKKLVRAKLDSTQLVQYFLGLLEIEQLERDYRQKIGSGPKPRRFNQRGFNEALLTPGSVAPKYIRWGILGETPDTAALIDRARDFALKAGWAVQRYSYPQVAQNGRIYSVRFRGDSAGDVFKVVINTVTNETQLIKGD
jgi:uncharacterized protein (DUF885 family)